MRTLYNTLIYKRTHRGDPDDSDVFGAHDCMGPVRDWNFDAVIGIGGSRPWSGHEAIANRINWIGIRPVKTKARNPKWRGSLVKFERVRRYKDDIGPMLKKRAPKLFKYMFEDQHVRVVMSPSLSNKMQDEIQKILRLAKKCRTRPLQSGKILSKTKCCVRKRQKPDC